MLGLDVRITDGFRLVLSYFFTVVNLVAVFEGKMVAICGVQLQLKQRELSEVLLLHSGGINGRGSSSGYVFGELPLFLVGTGVLAAVLSSYVSYVFYRCRIERWRSRKSIMPTLANNVLLFQSFLWLASLVLTANVFRYHGTSRNDLLGLSLEYIHDGFIKNAMRLYRRNATIKSAIDRMQMRLKCCGENSYAEWFQMPWADEKYLRPGTYGSGHREDSRFSFRGGYDEQGVPFSCCNPAVPGPCDFERVRSDTVLENIDGTFNIHNTGCKSAVNVYMLESVKVFCIVALMNFVSNLSVSVSSRFLIYSDLADPGSKPVDVLPLPRRSSGSLRETLFPLPSSSSTPFEPLRHGRRSPKKSGHYENLGDLSMYLPFTAEEHRTGEEGARALSTPFLSPIETGSEPFTRSNTPQGPDELCLTFDLASPELRRALSSKSSSTSSDGEVLQKSIMKSSRSTPGVRRSHEEVDAFSSSIRDPWREEGGRQRKKVAFSNSSINLECRDSISRLEAVGSSPGSNRVFRLAPKPSSSDSQLEKRRGSMETPKEEENGDKEEKKDEAMALGEANVEDGDRNSSSNASPHPLLPWVVCPDGVKSDPSRSEPRLEDEILTPTKEIAQARPSGGSDEKFPFLEDTHQQQRQEQQQEQPCERHQRSRPFAGGGVRDLPQSTVVITINGEEVPSGVDCKDHSEEPQVPILPEVIVSFRGEPPPESLSICRVENVPNPQTNFFLLPCHDSVTKMVPSRNIGNVIKWAKECSRHGGGEHDQRMQSSSLDPNPPHLLRGGVTRTWKESGMPANGRGCGYHILPRFGDDKGFSCHQHPGERSWSPSRAEPECRYSDCTTTTSGNFSNNMGSDLETVEVLVPLLNLPEERDGDTLMIGQRMSIFEVLRTIKKMKKLKTRTQFKND